MAQKTYPDILYTTVDEAPELASTSLLPIIQSFARGASIHVEKRDISLAGRIIAAFPENLSLACRQADHLAELGQLVKTPSANIIKLPNISASTQQLTSAIAELQAQGYGLPEYPEQPATEAETSIRTRYDAVKGSAVNPILREGNSDRRAAKAVKHYAMQNPHSMGPWSAISNTHVTSMPADDFFSNETSATITQAQAGLAKITFTDGNGQISVLKDGLNLLAGTVVDATFMSAAGLR
ncbi:MAG: NADP-dependent isocitrate dehydrogenase, partial [Paracoccaceae bacterium]|nr:NADP-dependent isocitrate dehydrogenase [Paracoccaceae bacterium]